MRVRRLGTAALAALAIGIVTACSPAAPDDAPSGEGVTTISLRLWDEDVATAYEASFEEFSEQNPDVQVQLNVVPWSDYFTGLTLDVASGTADDVYWLNSSYFGALADQGKLLDVGKELSGDVGNWVPAAVEQYSRNGTLWGVPALTDGRIVVFYNKELVDAAGVDPESLTWNPVDVGADTFLPAARSLTVDGGGRTADKPDFDPTSVTQYGFNAARDLQAIYWNFVGSNGGRLQNPDDTLVLTEPKTVEAFDYLVRLVNRDHVSPSAADTNDNDDFSRDQFLQGKMALFQSGAYNLQNIQDGAQFDWGIAPLLAGPEGRVSVVNSVIAAGNADSPKRDAVLRVLRWLGSEQGASHVGAEGAALPAVTAAQQGYYDYWEGVGVDTRFFGEEGGTETIPAPSGPKFGAASTAFEPILNEVFAGRTPVAEGLQQAQDAGNAALR